MRNLPQHLAIIMDGNGRWAAERGLPKVMGYRAGSEAVRGVLGACGDLGIKILTLYTFSSENWRRPKAEIDEFMMLLQEFLRREAPNLHANRIRLHVLGRLWELPTPVQSELRRAMALTRHNTKLQLNLALNYGGRQELVDAMRSIAQLVKQGVYEVDQITESVIAEHLYTAGSPDPDLLIRTSGELRLSNFLLWQISYTEIYVTPTLWPDFTREELQQAITAYQQRERRFGSRTPVVEGA